VTKGSIQHGATASHFAEAVDAKAIKEDFAVMLLRNAQGEIEPVVDGRPSDAARIRIAALMGNIGMRSTGVEGGDAALIIPVAAIAARGMHESSWSERAVRAKLVTRAGDEYQIGPELTPVFLGLAEQLSGRTLQQIQGSLRDRLGQPEQSAGRTGR
jgi:hypothetical protein